jgi:hypothetical protein
VRAKEAVGRSRERETFSERIAVLLQDRAAVRDWDLVQIGLSDPAVRIDVLQRRSPDILRDSSRAAAMENFRWTLTTGHRNVRQGDSLSCDYESPLPFALDLLTSTPSPLQAESRAPPLPPDPAPAAPKRTEAPAPQKSSAAGPADRTDASDPPSVPPHVSLPRS